MRTTSIWFIFGLCAVIGMCAAVLGCSKTPQEKVVPLNVSNADPFTQAVVAAKTGDVNALEKIIATSPDVLTDKASDGMTLLHYAAGASRADVVKLLLDKGADVNAVNDENQTPLGCATDTHAGQDVVELLEGAGGK